mgnify:CR=1 FL=1
MVPLSARGTTLAQVQGCVRGLAAPQPGDTAQIDIWNSVREQCPVATTERYGRAHMPVTMAAVQQYRRAAHTIYALHYHFVFITKYRKPVLRGDLGTEVRDLIREICRRLDIEIMQGHVRPDHVHLLLSVPPHAAGLMTGWVETDPDVLRADDRAFAGDGAAIA